MSRHRQRHPDDEMGLHAEEIDQLLAGEDAEQERLLAEDGVTTRQFAPAVGLHATSNGVYPPLTCSRCWPDEAWWNALRERNGGSDVLRLVPGPMVHIRAGREMFTPQSHYVIWEGEQAEAWGGFGGWAIYGYEDENVREVHACDQPMLNGLALICETCKTWSSFPDVRYAGPFDLSQHAHVMSDAGWTCNSDGKQALCGACQSNTSITQRAA